MQELVIGSISGLTLGLLVGAYIAIARVQAATARLEQKLDALVRHAGIDVNRAAVEAAQGLMRAGKKIEAIKVYREATGVGLAEAKRAVEQLT